MLTTAGNRKDRNESEKIYNMQIFYVTHWYINPANKMAMLDFPSRIEAHEQGMLTGIFNVTEGKHVCTLDGTRIGRIKRVLKDGGAFQAFIEKLPTPCNPKNGPQFTRK